MKAPIITTIKPRVIPGGILALATALLVWVGVPGTASAHGSHLKAKMSSDQVVGQAGAPGGEGTAKLHVVEKKDGDKWGTICLAIKYSGIGSPHGLDIGIHAGKKGQNGAFWIDPGKKGCTHDFSSQGSGGVSVNQKLKRMTRTPRRFYVQVATDEYPDGAIRGQLKAMPAATGTRPKESTLSTGPAGSTAALTGTGVTTPTPPTPPLTLSLVPGAVVGDESKWLTSLLTTHDNSKVVLGGDVKRTTMRLKDRPDQVRHKLFSAELKHPERLRGRRVNVEVKASATDVFGQTAGDKIKYGLRRCRAGDEGNWSYATGDLCDEPY